MQTATVNVPESAAAVAPAISTTLRPLFEPRSVAVVGALGPPGSVPHDIFENLLHSGFVGTLYPVAPGKEHVCSVRAYRYVLDIDRDVDLAVIVYPSGVVERAIEQCARKHIPAAIIISAGFREAGPEGVAREEAVKRICRDAGIVLVGPNCLGVINTDPHVMLNASFAMRMPLHGSIAFISQSGALCTAVLDYAQDKKIGFSKFVSFGNRAGVTEMDLLRYLHRDEQTRVILMYLEEIADGRALLEAAREVTHGAGGKPIFAIKAGRTAEGAAAAASHTGSLATEDRLCDDLFAEAGIVRVDGLEQLFNAAVLHDADRRPAGERIGIVTNGGGPGVMATDAAVRVGLQVPRLADPTRNRLRGALPPTANLNNPVDVIGDARADRYQSAIEAVLEDPQIDQLLVILTPQSMTDVKSIARTVIDARRQTAKLVACSFMGSSDVAEGVAMLQHEGVPHYILPEWACRAFADLRRAALGAQPAGAEPAPSYDRSTVQAIIDRAGTGYLTEAEVLAILDACDLPVPPVALARSCDEAVSAAERVGFPAALRVVSRDVIHKTEAGGVRLNLQSTLDVRAAWDRMMTDVRAKVPRAVIEGALVRRMLPDGCEVIIGARRDRAFGPVVMFGLGGTYVELFKDVAFASAPLTCSAAGELIQRTLAARLLSGLRRKPPCDLDAVARHVAAVSRLVADFERIEELDINPLICWPGERGAGVADARIRLS